MLIYRPILSLREINGNDAIQPIKLLKLEARPHADFFKTNGARPLARSSPPLQTSNHPSSGPGA